MESRSPDRSHPADRWLAAGSEPRLDEMLGDETLAVLMARDHLARDQLLNLIWALRYAARRQNSRKAL